MHRVVRGSVVLAPIAALAVALAAVDVGMFSYSPGPAREVLPLIEMDGARTYPGNGRLLLTTVSVSRTRPVGIVRAWVDPTVEVVPEHVVIPRGETEEEYEEETQTMMDESKIAAISLVLEMLTDYPEEHGAGALVAGVQESTPADGVLHTGDVIVAIDDRAVRDVGHLSSLVRRAGEGRTLTLTVEAAGEERTVRLRPERPPGEEHAVMGVMILPSFPFEVVIDSGAIGGPSAGLMWALGVYELLTPQDLLDGREVAGTGIIGRDGRVAPVGGIEQKVRAAEEAGADLFILPADNLEAAEPMAGDLPLLPVRSVEEAISVLLPGGDAAG